MSRQQVWLRTGPRSHLVLFSPTVPAALGPRRPAPCLTPGDGVLLTNPYTGRTSHWLVTRAGGWNSARLIYAGEKG